MANNFHAILKIASTNSRHKDMKKGFIGAKENFLHAVRLKDRDKYSTNVNHKKTHLNQFFDPTTKKWIPIGTKQNRETFLNKFIASNELIFQPFKNELKQRNKINLDARHSTRIKNFSNYLATKQPVGEIILAGSRTWFERNNVIKIIDEKNFTVKNQKKLMQWANCVNDWMYQKITKFYGSHSFLGSTLHLDESNVHIHFFHSRALHKFNKKENKKTWSFTSNGLFDPIKMRELHKEYRTHQNKVLFSELGWDKNNKITLSNTAKKDYLSLYHYKRTQAKQELDYTIAKTINAQTMAKRWSNLYGNDFKKAMHKIHIGLEFNKQNLILEGRAILESLGHTTQDITTIIEQITAQHQIKTL